MTTVDSELQGKLKETAQAEDIDKSRQTEEQIYGSPQYQICSGQM